MQRFRPLFIAVGILIALGLFLWLVSAVGTLYSGVSAFSPLLAQMLVTLLVLVALVALGVVGYYGWLFLRPRHQRSLPPPPETVAEAAAVNLDAVQQQIDQIQDQVMRQALGEQSQKIAGQFRRQAYQIVIFGAGSVGKTALANALMGEIAGPIAPTKGTTAMAQTYRLRVPNLDREIWLMDSPGILDVAVDEQIADRDAQTRQLATAADLLLYVVDNDLHRAEYEALYQLLTLGKRSILVFNKVDRYTDAEKAAILSHLRERLHGLLQPQDVVSTSACPEPVRLPDQDWLQPDPETTELIERIVAILRSEGETLLADNILLQSHQLGQAAREQLIQQRQRQADAIIDRYQWIGAGVLAATPLPVVDMLATAAINAQMVVELGRVYGIEVSIEDARALALSLAKTMTSLGVVKGTLKLLSLGLQANLATAVVGKLLQGASAAYLTHIAGKSFITYFQQNQTWGEGGMQTVIEQQYQLNRRDQFVQQFINQALERVSPWIRSQEEGTRGNIM